HGAVQLDGATAVARPHGTDGGVCRFARHSPPPGGGRQSGYSLQHAGFKHGRCGPDRLRRDLGERGGERAQHGLEERYEPDLGCRSLSGGRASGQLVPGQPEPAGLCKEHNRWGFLVQRSADFAQQTGIQRVAIRCHFHLVEAVRYDPRRHRQRNDEGANFPSDPFNPRFDRGPTAFDAKFNLRVNEVYTIPNIHADGFLAGLEKGWKWSNIVSAQSGYPFECMTQYGTNPSNSEMGIEDIGGDLSNDRCNEVTAANLSYATGLNANAVPYNAKTVLTKIATPTENQWFNPNMFTMPVAGTLGTSARGLMRGPGQFDWDLSLVKDTHLKWLGEGGNLQFRAEVFNILNHTNFAFPYSNNFNAN